MAQPRKAKWDEILDNQVVQASTASGNQSGRWLGHLSLGIGLVILCGLFSSWIHVQSIACRYQYSQAFVKQQKLHHAQNALKIESQMLRAPQTISELAENKLGMVLPDPGDRVVMK